MIVKIDRIEDGQSHKIHCYHGKSVVATVTTSLPTGGHVTLPSISKHFLVLSHPREDVYAVWGPVGHCVCVGGGDWQFYIFKKSETDQIKGACAPLGPP